MGYCKEARTVTGVWVMIILARSVPEVERVTSTVRDFILYIGWTAVGRIKKEKCTIPIYAKPFARRSLEGWQQ